MTTLHYAETLENDANRSFVAAYEDAYGEAPDTYAVQGYDTGMMLAQALNVLGGDTSDRDRLIDVLANVQLASPRGPLSFSDSHHPIQNVYLREIRDGKHEVVSIAAENLEVPDDACQM